MAVAFGAVGAGIGTATSPVTVSMPLGISAGDLLVMGVISKYPTITPSASGWTIPTNGQGSGGAGAPGLNSGTVNATFLVKEAVGGEGSTSVTLTGLNCAYVVVARYTKAAGGTWSYVATNGGDNSAGGSFSVTGAADPGCQSGDMMLVLAGQNGDGASDTQSLSQTGMTWGAANERFDSGTSAGDDVGIQLVDFAASAGTSSAAPVYTANIGFSGAGAAAFLRIREVSGAAVSQQLSMMGIGS